MPILKTDTGETWHLTDAQAANVRTLASLPQWELEALLTLARAQAKLDASLSRPPRATLRIVTEDGAIVRPFPCRHAREAEARGDIPSPCRWLSDSAGGYACNLCGTWAQPNSERARVLDQISSATEPPVDREIGLGINRVAVLKLVDDRISETGERPGQALFNVLHERAPEIAERIRGTKADPFHSRERGDARWCAALDAVDRYPDTLAGDPT